MWLLGIASLSHVWYGSLLAWKSLRKWRDLSPTVLNASEGTAATRINRPRRLGFMMLGQATFMTAITLLMLPQFMMVGYDRLIVSWCVFFPVWSASWTGLILLLALTLSAAGAERTYYFPLLIPVAGVALLGMVQLSTIADSPGLLAHHAFVVGLATGLLGLGHIEGGNLPVAFARIKHRCQRRQRFLQTVVAFLLSLYAILLFERMKGSRMLAGVKEDMVRRGQRVDYTDFVTSSSPDFAGFERGQLRPPAGPGMQGGIELGAGKAARGSQAPRPVTRDQPPPVFTNGVALTESGTTMSRWTLPARFHLLWRELVFHPLWSFSWAEQEAAIWLQWSDPLATDLAKRSQRRAFAGFDSAPPKIERCATFRFCFEAPLELWMIRLLNIKLSTAQGDGLKRRFGSMANRDFAMPLLSIAIGRAAAIENLRQMAVTALALKRYRLRHKQYPNSLAELSPAFLAETPIDWMDGQPLRYRLKLDGSYLLYSVGEDGIDDNGEAGPRDPNTPRSRFDGRDLVWPVEVAWKWQRSFEPQTTE